MPLHDGGLGSFGLDGGSGGLSNTSSSATGDITSGEISFNVGGIQPRGIKKQTVYIAAGVALLGLLVYVRKR